MTLPVSTDDVYRFVVWYKKRAGEPPTYRDIASFFGCSVSVAYERVVKLRELNLVSMTRHGRIQTAPAKRLRWRRHERTAYEAWWRGTTPSEQTSG